MPERLPRRRLKKTPPPNITYSAELQRKAIHLCSMGIPVGAWFLPLSFTLLILLAMFLVSLLIDLELSRRSHFGRWINRWFGFMLRPHEKAGPGGGIRPTGSTWMLLSAIVTFALFPREIAVAAFSMLILCDTVAALVGRKWGSVRFGPKRKSVEGSTAFFVMGVLVIACVPGLGWWAGILGALAATVAEALPWEWDDNFTVPLASGFVMAMVSFLL